MEFTEECKVIIGTMDESDAKAYVKFLLTEIARHKQDIDNATDLCYDVIRRFHLGDILVEE